jgi:hypothetical protein
MGVEEIGKGLREVLGRKNQKRPYPDPSQKPGRIGHPEQSAGKGWLTRHAEGNGSAADPTCELRAFKQFVDLIFV